MASNESVLVDNFIAAAQAERDEPLPDEIAFETFGAQMVLRDRNLSDDEIELGRIGGGKDGALDGVYVFLDGALLGEDSEIFSKDFSATKSVRKNPKLELKLIQSKRETSFTETAVDKADSSLQRLLDLNTTDDAELLTLYSAEVIARIRIFTNAWKILSIRSPIISITFDYVTKGDTSNVAAAVTKKANDLANRLASIVTGASTEVNLLGAKELWTAANAVPEYNLQLRFGEYFSKDDSYTGLVALADYYEFLSDADGNLRGHLFDWNVRDFQGAVSVNKDMQSTLESEGNDDFWWLNNGVTILCSEVNISGKTFTMENVQIVNGMQTSHSIHSAISRIDKEDERRRGRSLLVRVFQTQDEATRDRIIRATNSQTKVPDASLHATEDIHRQLEAFFLSNGWYYDRRKNFYRNIGKPSDRIVSIPALGQAIMAIGLGQPDAARARPSTLLKNAVDYGRIFSPSVPLETYLWLAQFQRRVDAVLLSMDNVDWYTRTNFRFHVSVYLATKLVEARIYNPGQLTEISKAPIAIEPTDVQAALEDIVPWAAEYGDLLEASIDRVVKSSAFANLVIELALGVQPHLDQLTGDDADEDAAEAEAADADEAEEDL